jgi:hypothetical protein
MSIVTIVGGVPMIDITELVVAIQRVEWALYLIVGAIVAHAVAMRK